jgi:hypothetical protein
MTAQKIQQLDKAVNRQLKKFRKSLKNSTDHCALSQNLNWKSVSKLGGAVNRGVEGRRAVQKGSDTRHQIMGVGGRQDHGGWKTQLENSEN